VYFLLVTLPVNSQEGFSFCSLLFPEGRIKI
jgi:hypothetical protein